MSRSRCCVRRGTVPAAPDSPEAAEILDALDRDRRRFLREIRTTAQLEHPGTPAVYDTGVETAADGTTRLWLVMQLLRGTTLEALLGHTDYDVIAAEHGVGGGRSRRRSRRCWPTCTGSTSCIATSSPPT